MDSDLPSGQRSWAIKNGAASLRKNGKKIGLLYQTGGDSAANELSVLRRSGSTGRSASTLSGPVSLGENAGIKIAKPHREGVKEAQLTYILLGTFFS